jgi:hypothetical protein
VSPAATTPLQQQRRRSSTAISHDDIRPERGQLRGVVADSVGISLAPADVDPHVAAIDPTQLLQRLPERRHAGLPL